MTTLAYSRATALRPLYGDAATRTAYRPTGGDLERRPAATPLAFRREAIAVARDLIDRERRVLAVQVHGRGVGIAYVDALEGRTYVSLDAGDALGKVIGADGFRAIADRLGALLGAPVQGYPYGDGWAASA